MSNNYKRIRFFLAGSLIMTLGLVTMTNITTLDHTKKPVETPYIVATTGMIGDAARNIVGNTVHVVVLMDPGIDPHTYKATLSDAKLLQDADAVFYNGLALEGKKMSQALEQLQKHKKHVYPLSEHLSPDALIIDANFQTGIDPHVWFDIPLWIKAIEGLGAALTKVFPQHAKQYTKNTKRYIQQLWACHAQLSEQAEQLPRHAKKLISTHDAFAYFARNYDFDVKSLQGISTVAEYSLQDLTLLIAFITKNRVPAIFVEPSLSPKSLQAVQKGCASKRHHVMLCGPLYADALGPTGSGADTYVGMMKANMNLITHALQS